MIIFNKKDSLYIEVDSQYQGGSFEIYSYDSFGCKSKESIVSGDLLSTVSSEVENSIISLEVKLPDGEYEIKIVKDNFPDEVERFNVFYNYLPEILKDLKVLFCSNVCEDCNEEDKEKEYLKVFTKLLLFLVSSKLIKQLPIVETISLKIQKVLSTDCMYKRYYGKSNFSYKDNLHMFFAYFYAELYNYQKNKIKSLNEDLKYVDEVFMFENISQCLYTSSMSLETVFHNICNLTCNCDE